MSISDTIGQALRDIDAEERAAKPRRDALDRFDRSTPRLVQRRTSWGTKTPIYQTVRLGDLRFVKAHVQTSFELGHSNKPIKRQVGDQVIVHGGSAMSSIPPTRLGEFVRRPTARALARIEAAEAAIMVAREELKAATRAAFIHGKPVPATTVRRTDAERRKIEAEFKP